MATYLNPALIADSVPEPQPVPGPIAMAEGVGRVRQLQQQNQQQAGLYPIAQEQAQVNLQGTQLDVQQKQQQLKDQNTIRQAYQDAIDNADPSKPLNLSGVVNGLAGKINPVTHLGLQKAVTEQQTALSKLNQDQLDNQKTKNGLLSDHLQAVMSIGSPDDTSPETEAKRAAEYTGQYQQAVQNGLVQPGQVPAQYPGLQAVKNFDVGLRGAAKQFEDEDARRQKLAAATETETKAQEAKRAQGVQDYRALPVDATTGLPDPNAVAQLQTKYGTSLALPTTAAGREALLTSTIPQKDVPEYQIKKNQADATKTFTSDKIAQTVNNQIDPQKYPTQNARARNRAQAALDAGEGPKGVMDAINKVVDGEVEPIERETNPAIIQAGITKAVGTQRALNAGSNAALANVPPHLTAPAASDYNKISNEYADSVAAADNIKSIIDLARAGNKVAYSYEPVAGVLTINTAAGVKHINVPEINKYGGAGSAADQVEGWLGKNLSGKSIPDNILDNMESMHSQLADNAARKYNDKVNNVNQTYGAAFKPAAIQPQFKAPLTPGEAQTYLKRSGYSRTTGPDGKVILPTQAQKDAATALAKKDGRELPQ